MVMCDHGFLSVHDEGMMWSYSLAGQTVGRLETREPACGIDGLLEFKAVINTLEGVGKGRHVCSRLDDLFLDDDIQKFKWIIVHSRPSFNK